MFLLQIKKVKSDKSLFSPVKNFSLIFCQTESGDVCDTNLDIFTGKGEIYHYFDTYNDALKHGNKIMSMNRDLEFMIYDANKNLLLAQTREDLRRK